MHCQAAGKTDIGLVRKINEDYLKIDEANRLFIVCDGMGGHNAGEVASMTSAETIVRLYGHHFQDLLKDERIKLPRMLPPSTDVLVKAVRIANHTVYNKAAADESMSGMGTTIVALAFEEDIATILHVGDSRIYRFYSQELTPLTTDHSWAAELEKNKNISQEEAAQLVNRNVITRALGVNDAVDIDVAIRKITEGEIYILCSDGLCGYVRDDDIRRTATSAGGDIEKIADLLVQMANERGGQDNVSVIAVKVTGKGSASQLSELDTIKIDAERSEYFPAEEEWVDRLGPLEEPDEEPTLVEIKEKKKGWMFPVILIFFVVLVWYFFLRG